MYTCQLSHRTDTHTHTHEAHQEQQPFTTREGVGGIKKQTSEEKKTRILWCCIIRGEEQKGQDKGEEIKKW